MRITLNEFLSHDAVPMRLPHFQLKSGSLYFLISRRPYATLNDEEQALWNAMDGTACIGDLRARFAASVDSILKTLVQCAYACWYLHGFPKIADGLL